MAEALLKTKGLIKRFGGLVATDNLSIEVREGEIHALIGPNGAGKTTGHSFRFLADVRFDKSLREPAWQSLELVGLDARAGVPAATLSHGEQRQLEIAMALAGKPRMLLLDEPMAGMGVEESQDMVQLLRHLKARCGMLLIEHDMDAVFALADRITVLVYGRAIASGTPDEIRASPEVRHAYLGEEAK